MPEPSANFAPPDAQCYGFALEACAGAGAGREAIALLGEMKGDQYLAKYLSDSGRPCYMGGYMTEADDTLEPLLPTAQVGCGLRYGFVFAFVSHTPQHKTHPNPNQPNPNQPNPIQPTRSNPTPSTTSTRSVLFG